MQENNIPLEITVQELKSALDGDNAPLLLDVRQIGEHQQGNIGGKLIQLDQLPARLGELEDHRDDQFVVYCRSGARSGRAVQFLRANGFNGATNLRGGLIAWRDFIDPTMIV